MTTFEYVAIFYGIVVALAVETVLASLHRLLTAGKRVRWHWMSPAIAFNAIILTLGEFWILWGDRGQWTGGFTFLEFLPFAITLFFMFMAAAATLPDEIPHEGLDLKAFYFENRKHYWGLVAAYFAFNILVDLVGLIRFGPNVVWQQHLRWFIGDFVALGVAGLMFLFRAYWLHAIGIVFGLVTLVAFLSSIPLS